jgi:hypothetical protein
MFLNLSLFGNSVNILHSTMVIMRAYHLLEYLQELVVMLYISFGSQNEPLLLL